MKLRQAGPWAVSLLCLAAGVATAAVPAISAGDGIAALYLERIARLRLDAPEPGWEGAVELEKL